MSSSNLPKRVLSWKVLEQCNYRCSYCLQKTYGYDSNYREDIPEIVSRINQCLDERYIIKIAGGEIFIKPNQAVLLAKEISKYEHWISLCTNFSASVEDYCRFIEASQGKLHKFAASLHTEYADPEVFLQKCLQIKRELPDCGKIQVHNVIPRGVENIKKLGEIKKRFDAENIIFYTDLLVDEKGKYIPYTSEEKQAIDRCLGEEDRIFRNTGKLCGAGESYFVLLPNLDAWTCWEAWYENSRKYYLGNMMDGTFAFSNKMTLCPFETCSCPTPLFNSK